MTRRRTTNRRTSRLARAMLASAIPFALIAAGLVPGPAAVASPDSAGRPALDLGDSVDAKPWQADSAAPPAAPTETEAPFKVPGPGSHRVAVPAAPADPAADPMWAPVGGTGIELAAAPGGPAVQVDIGILPAKEARFRAAGSLALTLTAAQPTEAQLLMRVPDALLDALHGGNFASRAVWATSPYPDLLSTVFAAQAPTSLPTHRTPWTSSATTSVALTTTTQMLSLLSGPVSSEGLGTWSATSLKPSGSWDVSVQTGAFTYSYPMRVPPAAAGPQPNVGLTYNSQSLDGLTGGTNNQASVVGDGWELAAGGFVERSYTPCSLDSTAPVSTSGDQCWAGDRISMSFAGHSGTLVPTGSNDEWRLESDDGSRIQRLFGASNGDGGTGTGPGGAGENWVLTTPDGTKYHFGLNRLPGWTATGQNTNSTWTVPVYGNSSGEPCYNAAGFSASSCPQAWRWNIDYIVDIHGNAQTFQYSFDENWYRQNGSTDAVYHRGGQLTQIRYGLTAATVLPAGSESGRVNFGYAPRCQAGCAWDGTGYPDVPTELRCMAPATCTEKSPTFWSTQKLTSIATQVKDGASFVSVDTWTLAQSLPSAEAGVRGNLWLDSISQAAPSAPLVTGFTKVPLANRPIDEGSSSYKELRRHRVVTVTNEMGAVTTVGYAPTDPNCTAANVAAIHAAAHTNVYWCFPQKWTPQFVPPASELPDLFHKYRVASVVTRAMPGTAAPASVELETHYTYGAPAWRFDRFSLGPAANRTWSVFAGVGTARISSGTAGSLQIHTDYRFFQGMDGDWLDTAGASSRSVAVPGTDGSSVPDSLWLAGRTYETVSLASATGPALTSVITTPWASSPTAVDGDRKARMVRTARVLTRSQLSGPAGLTPMTDVTTQYDARGRAWQVNDASSDAGTTCTTTTYAAEDTAKWLIEFPSQTSTMKVACADLASAQFPGDVVNQARVYYDSGALGAVPIKGDITRTETAKTYAPGNPAPTQWLATTKLYDGLGRVTQTTDALSRTTTTAYTPSGQGAPQSQTVTNPMGWTTTTTYDARWGVPKEFTDANARKSTAEFDALGRVTKVWNVDRPRATYPNDPSTAFAYNASTTSASSVKTTSRVTSGTIDSYAFYDGLGRPVQTQSPSSGGGVLIADTEYDGAGRILRQTSPYFDASKVPSSTFLERPALGVPAVESTYDASGRLSAQILRQASDNIEKWRTSYTYLGVNRTDTTPPSGGTPTSTITNSRGQTVNITRWTGATPATGTGIVTSYGFDARGNMTTMVERSGQPVINLWTWTYDVLGRQTGASDPDSGVSSTVYDDGGRATSTTDGNGQVIAYTYDDLDRKTGQYDGSTSGPKLAAWTYDVAAKGMPAAATAYVGSAGPSGPALGSAYTVTNDTYDLGYRLTKQTTTIPSIEGALSGSYITQATYGPSGKLATQTLESRGGLPAETLRYGRDSLDLPGGLASTEASYLGGVYYTHLNQVAQTSQAWGPTVYRTFTYERDTSRMVEAVTQISAAYNAVVSDDLYTYDNAGNITAIKSTYDTGNRSTGPTTRATDNQCFAYDRMRNLTDAWTPANGDCAAAKSQAALGGPAPYWNTYGYDLQTGNRTSATVRTNSTSTAETYTYPAPGAARPHAVTSVVRTGSAPATWNYTYDNAGASTSRPGHTIVNDKLGRPRTTTTSAGTQTSTYTADGALLLQSDPATGTTLFLGATELHLNPGASTVTGTRTYSVEGIGPVAERTAAGTTGTSKLWFQASDHHGTVTAQIEAQGETGNATGNLTRRYQDPFGAPRGTAPAWSSGRAFLDAPTNPHTGLTRLGARDYDPAIGKFTSPDPVLATGNPASLNAYAYAENNPINLSDPTGLCPGPCVPGLGKALGDKTKVQATPGIFIDASNPNAKKIAQGVQEYVKEKGFAFDFDDAGQNSLYEVVAFQGYCEENRKLCGNSMFVFLTNLHNTLMSYGTDYQSLEQIVLGGNGGTSLSGIDFTAIVAEIALDIASTISIGGGGSIQVAPRLSRQTKYKLKELGLVKPEASSCPTRVIRNSFAADTLVVLADGSSTKPISEIRPGERVLTFNTSTGERVDGLVVNVLLHADADLLDIRLASDGAVETLRTTQSHLFYDGEIKGWTRAGDLRPGTRMLTADGSNAVVAEASPRSGPAFMWDLDVANNNNFFVAVESISALVHNCDFESRGSSGRTTPGGHNEEQAMAYAREYPQAGTRLPTRMEDDRWNHKDGWVKMSLEINGIEIHYNYNTRLNVYDDFKFKDWDE